MDNPSYVVRKPRFRTDHDWKLAYGLECIRIWKEAVDHLERTGEEIDSYYPTEEEFREARRMSWRKRIYYPGADGRLKKK